MSKIRQFFCWHKWKLIRNNGVDSDFICSKCHKADKRSLADMYV